MNANPPATLDRFPLGFGFAPLVLAPFSEAYGRYMMYAASSIVVVIFYIPTALAKNVRPSPLVRPISLPGANDLHRRRLRPLSYAA